MKLSCAPMDLICASTSATTSYSRTPGRSAATNASQPAEQTTPARRICASSQSLLTRRTRSISRVALTSSVRGRPARSGSRTARGISSSWVTPIRPPPGPSAAMTAAISLVSGRSAVRTSCTQPACRTACASAGLPRNAVTGPSAGR